MVEGLLLVPPGGAVRGVGSRQDGLDPVEAASVDELRALQAERLRWSVRHAHGNVAHYRSVFDAAGVRPEDVVELSDLGRLPFTTKGDLRANHPFGMFAVPREQVVRVHASSGTTGTPTVVGYTRGDLETWGDVMARSIRAAGGRAGDTVHNAYGYGLFTGGLGAHYGAERLGCTVVPASGGMSERQVRLIDDLRPDVIMATPSYMLALVDEMERQGIDPRSTSLRAGIFGAEPWTEAMRGEMERRLDMHAVDIYGLSEVIGPGVASECVETKDGLHVWEDHFYPEIIDPLTGEVLPDGEHGELVLTSLTKQAMPVIRYRTGDLTRLLPGTARTMRRIERITGRTDDMIILRGVNLFPTQIEELILRMPDLSPHFQCVLARTGSLDSLTVRVERRAAVTAEGAAQAGTLLKRRVKDAIGVSVGVDVVAPGAVERSAGKMRRIVDDRPGR
ncbi:phenylacetate--CoA ligase PaaK [Nocardiopsis mangrovi]|uniref:Phenylacetate-coenzyme A ligase n=1 Tax=Nocardiopsis mangrovi TaxID=1179818 RepID=A0ABV9E1J7_9ACTN